MMACKPRLYFSKKAEGVAKKEETRNIVKFLYSILAENKSYNEGPPTYCRGCGASVCLYSELLTRDEYYKKLKIEVDSEQIPDEKKAELDKKDEVTNFLKGKYLKDLSLEEFGWICEFCGVHNRVPKNIAKPQNEDEVYLLKKAPEVPKKTNTVEEHKIGDEVPSLVDTSDETSLIFCIDVSGSMGETHKVEKDGKTTNISRIKLIQDAVLKQLEDMRTSHPNRIVGIVSFEDHVRLYSHNGDPVLVNVNNSDYDKLLSFARERSNVLLNEPLHQSFDQITKAIKTLMPLSCTALGPGLLCSLGLLQGRRGSRVILCTDGLANVGLGSLGGKGEVSTQAREFYDRLGDLAVECGLSISIITVEGNACRVDALGPLTDKTGGTIHRVNPANVDLSEITQNSLIATNVHLKVIMHEGLAFEHQNVSLLQNNGSILVKKIGSVTANSEEYFEYRVKGTQELEKVGLDLEEIKSIPMQSQITYTDMKGNEFVRVISKQQGLTQDQKEAKKGVKANILSGYVQTESANLVLQGKAQDAKEKNQAWAEYMENVLEEECFEDNGEVWKDFKQQNMELHDLIEQNEAHQGSNNVAKKDDISSKLYKIKQAKKM